MEVPSSTRICDVKAGGAAYFGRVVVLQGSYVTDSSNFAFLEDSQCSHKSLLSVSDNHAQADSSVKDFDQARKRHCKSYPGLCVYSVPLVVEAEIVRGEAGHLGLGEGLPSLRFRKVYSFGTFTSP